jgi:4-hydroxy-tetrahydrodipicolinate reductase
MTKAVLIGATGRMGTAIVRACATGGAPLEIVAAVASAGSQSQGRDIGELAGIAANGVRVRGELPADLARAQVAIDFSRPDLSLRALNVARAARDIAVLVAPNTSLGVAVAQELVRIAAQALPRDFDIEIVEAHHKHKVDAPSGTALALADSAARARGLDPHADTLTGRSGQSQRREGEIGIASLRAGDIVGMHTVLFAGSGERLTVGHEATDRSVFAWGAIRAAGWLAAQKPGRYTMAHVLGLKTTG